MNAETSIPTEIAKFNKMASHWWDREGPMWPLHKLNDLRVPFIERHSLNLLGLQHSESFRGVSVLDIGCGAGILSESIARLGAAVRGIDAAEKSIAIARQHAGRQGLNIQYEACSLDALSDDETYDLVLNMEVVEHVADLHSFMDLCANRVRPGGLMFVATINRTLYAMATAILGAEYVLRWLPRGTHQYSQLVKPKELNEHLRRGQLTVEDSVGVGVNPFTKNLYLTGFQAGNYMIVAKKQA